MHIEKVLRIIFDRAVVLIEKPFLPDSAYFEILITKVVPMWTGGVMLRFVTDLKFASEHNSAGDEPIDNITLKPGDVVGLLRDKEGKSCYYYNGQPIGEIKWLEKLPTNAPLFAVIDIYGQTEEICLSTLPEWSIQSHHQFPSTFKRVVKELLLIHRREGNLLATLPKFVLFDLIAILAQIEGPFFHVPK